MAAICVLNAGSSTLKYAVYATEPALRRVAGATIEGGSLDEVPVPKDVAAFGHRVVHGGPGAGFARRAFMPAPGLATASSHW